MSDSSMYQQPGANRRQGFAAAYAQHLAEHRDPVNRKYHFVATGSAILMLVHVGCSGRLWLLALMPIAYYGLSLYGHKAVEKNSHSTFKRPLRNIACDLRMFWDVFSQNLSIR